MPTKIACLISFGLLVGVLASNETFAGEILYNGISLPDQWPPKVEKLTLDPLATPHYLVSPPSLIPIDVGRQLFVDDFLVEDTTLTRTHHPAQYHPGNPVLRPEKDWEGIGKKSAVVYTDSVWYDPADRVFKAWYRTAPVSNNSPRRRTCLAISRDGIHWDKSSFDVIPGTNAIVADEAGLYRASNTVWLDLQEKDPERRFKMFRVVVEEKSVDGKRQMRKWMKIHFSPDGIRWKFAGDSDECGDRSTVFYNPFRTGWRGALGANGVARPQGVWVFSLRTGTKEAGRCRAYYEHADVLQGLRWGDISGKEKWTLWVGADKLDPPRSDLNLANDPKRPWDIAPPQQLYNLDCLAYESLILGLFSIWRGQPKDRPKINEVCVGFSRDGFHWSRPDRRAFCPVSEDKNAWNYGNVQSASGCCLVVGDKLYFYVSGAAQGSRDPNSTGLAILRRDGFTSMDAGEQEACLTTRPVKFSGKRLFVNVNAPKGRLLVEALDADGKVIAPFTRDNCTPMSVDSTIQPVRWRGADDLSSLAGKPVRFRFYLTQGQLYSFWVSPDASGASHGYVAAGGPGFTGLQDTVGLSAYGAVQKR